MSGLISYGSVPPLNQNGVGNTNIAPPIQKPNTIEIKLFSEKRGNSIVAMLPVLTVSEANGGPKKTFRDRAGKTHYKGEHWTDKHKRHKKQKGLVSLMLRKYRKDYKLPCLITLTRFAPNKLDRFDNLPMSLKWILDSVCAEITGDFRPGRADDNEEIDVRYRQEIHEKYGVFIEITI